MNRTRNVGKAITLTVTCLGSLMVLLDATIVVTALPTIQNSLHTNLSDLQWAISAYTLSFATLMLTAGTLGDRFGRKRFFLIGLILFILGSAFCGLAPSLGWLLFGRALQGVGAAALSPGSLSVLAAAFPEPRERAQAIGLWAGVSGLGLAIGPLAGGWLISIASWPAIFFVNLPIGLLALVLSIPGLTESRDPKARPIDVPGQLLVIGALVCLVMAFIEGPSLGWTSSIILALFGGAVVGLVAFIVVEALVREPMVPLSLFGNPVFSISNLAGVVVSFTIMGTLFFLVQFLQDVQGSSAFVAGLQTLPVSVCMFVSAPLVGRLTARLGPRLPTVFGALLCTASLALLTFLEPATPYSTLWWQMGIFGIGCGCMLTPLTTAVLSATPPARSGLGSSLLNTFRQVGMTLGAAVLGAVLLQQFPGNIVAQLTRAGLPATASATIARKLAAAGAGATLAAQPGRSPLPLTVLHQAIGQAFADSLHVTFLISGIALLATAVLVALWLRPPRPSTTTTSVEEVANVPVATGVRGD